MTRSDLILEVAKAEAKEEMDEATNRLVHKMWQKIDNAYKIVFHLEADPHFKELGNALRKALES